MRTQNLSIAILTASVLVVFTWTIAPGLFANPGDLQTNNSSWRNGSNMLCVPEPEHVGGGYRLSCYIPDAEFHGTGRSGRSDSEILRDLYREKYEPPFWKN